MTHPCNVTTTDDVELDLLEQCRAGDREAFRALVAFWGDPALRLASVLTSSARAAAGDAFTECWRALPSVHSETPFRPYLLGLVARAALAHGPGEGTAPLERCMAMLDEDARAIAALSAHARMHLRDVARAWSMPIAQTALEIRQALRSLQRCLGSRPQSALADAGRDVHLDNHFFDQVVMPHLVDESVLDVRRIVQRPPNQAWAILVDPTALPAWVSASGAHVRGGGSVHPGAHIGARGRIADRLPSRDRTIVTIVEQPRLLAWTTRAHVGVLSAPIEFRWSIEIGDAPGGSELIHRLRGVAFPHGLSGRVLRAMYERVGGSMQQSMHHGLERLASLVEASPL